VIRRAAVPFHLSRGRDEFAGGTITSTTERIHGLLRLEGDRLVFQWRLARRTEHMGTMDIRSAEEVEAVRELVVPLSGLAGAAVRRRWWIPGKPTLVLRAADLRAFEEVAGQGGLRLDHPAELVLGLRRADLLVAEEFSAEVTLAVAERALTEGEGSPALERPEPGWRLGPAKEDRPS
jgi:hypothetical protein